MGGRHCDDESENVIDECVEGFVHECAPGKSGDRFELVIDEKLRTHEQKSEGVDAVDEGVDRPTVP